MTKSLLALCALSLLTTASRADTVTLSSLDLSKTQQGWGAPHTNLSVDGKPLAIGGRSFAGGLGTHAAGLLWLDLRRAATRFTASVGVDDEVGAGKGSVEFLVRGEEKILWRSGVMRSGDAAKMVDVDVSGLETLVLQVTDAGDGDAFDHADWADAALTFIGQAPQTRDFPRSDPGILTPAAKPTPRINGPKIFGVRPGAPFAYSIPAMGNRPLSFSASGLPKGLKLDTSTGRISGRLDKVGNYNVRLRAKNALGTADRSFQIRVGEAIQLTPPLGWNSWNCWGPRVDEEKVRRSARALVAAGLDRHGWNFINIDDAWQGTRGGPLNAIQPNEKFPNMKGLVDEIHGLGLKTGIYSSPWMTTYAQHIGGSADNAAGAWNPLQKAPQALGAYSFARADARQWALWGIDYLKYDWSPVKVAQSREMHDALRLSGRDIVLSLSNNGAQTLQKDIKEVAPTAQLWRTTDDIFDNWSSMSRNGFTQDEWTGAQSPGHFNDPDMLIVGNLFGWSDAPRPTRLTPDEQYTHLSLWSLLGAPLLIGCDLETLDPFTLGLLTNDEVIDIDQDSLGRHGARVWNGGAENTLDVYAKPLEDGSLAVGLFNRDLFSHSMAATWDTLGIKGRQTVRDVWRQKDAGVFADRFEATIAPHGVMLLKISPLKSR